MHLFDLILKEIVFQNFNLPIILAKDNYFGVYDILNIFSHHHMFCI